MRHVKSKVKPYRPLSQKVVKNILNANPQTETESEQNTIQIQDGSPLMMIRAAEAVQRKEAEASAPTTLHRKIHYDHVKPEERIREFIAFSKDVVSRYEEDLRLITECETQTQDVLHYMELHDNADGPRGYKLYKTLREIRRKRRECKNEAALLKPVYEFIVENKSTFDKLAQIQGQCRSAKSTIDARCYMLKTGVIS